MIFIYSTIQIQVDLWKQKVESSTFTSRDYLILLGISTYKKKCLSIFRYRKYDWGEYYFQTYRRNPLYYRQFSNDRRYYSVMSPPRRVGSGTIRQIVVESGMYEICSIGIAAFRKHVFDVPAQRFIRYAQSPANPFPVLVYQQLIKNLAFPLGKLESRWK